MSRRLCVAWVVGVLSGVVSSSDGASVTRGPYLQVGTPSCVVVRWRTDSATDSRVRFGSSTENLAGEASDAQLVTDHLVRVCGLDPATRYYYAVGSSEALLTQPDTQRYFVTSPVPGTSPFVHMWVTGDFGYPGGSQLAARDAFYAYNAGRHCDLWLWLGDAGYFNGEDWEFQSRLFDVFSLALGKWVSWPCPGNHDLNLPAIPVDSRPYYLNFTMPLEGEAGGVASGTEHFYSFDYGNAHFVSLDAVTESRSSTGRMATWLVRDLQANTLPWTIVVWHYPPYCRGSYNSDLDPVMRQMREVFNPIVEAAGVDLVLGGHSHSYERSYLIDGHYGLAATLTPNMILDAGDGSTSGDGAYHKPGYLPRAHRGTVYVVNGACANVATGMPLDHPVMCRSLAVLGTMEIDINGNSLDARYIDANRAIVDEFTIIKDGNYAAATLGDARAQPDGTPVAVGADVAVTLVPGEGGVFYVEALDRSCGMRAISLTPAPAVGTRGKVSGTLTTALSGERMLNGTSFAANGAALIEPLVARCSAVGGKGYSGDTACLTTQGLLLRVSGRVVSVDSAAGAFWLEDGANIEPGGIEILHTGALPPVGTYVTAVGVVSAERAGAAVKRLILSRGEVIPH